jgi:hypothetical protein
MQEFNLKERSVLYICITCSTLRGTRHFLRKKNGTLWFHKVFSVDGEVPELAVFLVEIPDVHRVVVGDELVTGRPLHHVDLRLKVVRPVWFAHLDDAEHDDEDGRPDVEVLPL